jgi:hypothetical protein
LNDPPEERVCSEIAHSNIKKFRDIELEGTSLLASRYRERSGIREGKY